MTDTTTSMYVDPESSSFDFSALVDTDGASALTAPDDVPVARSTQSPEPSDEGDEYYSDPTEGTDDLVGNLTEDDLQFNPHNGIAPDDYFDTLDDNATLNFNGTPLTKAQLNDIVKDHEFSKTNADFYRNQDAFAFNQYNQYIEATLNESTSETERNIQWLRQAMSETKNDPSTYGKYALELDRQMEKKAVLDARNDEIKQIRDLQQQQITQAKIQETDTAMLRKYGQRWSQEGAGVYQWAVERGIPFESLKGALCPALADILMTVRDMEFRHIAKQRNTQQQANNVMKGFTASSRSSQKTTQRSSQTDHLSAKRGQLRQKMSSGGLTQDEVASMFDTLVD